MTNQTCEHHLESQDRFDRWEEEGGIVMIGGDAEERREFATAFLGATWQSGVPVAVYDRDGVIQVYVDRDGMNFHEAEEFFAFNTERAYTGKQTPIFVDASCY